MIPDFKTFINESVWSDIHKRSNGSSIRQENIGKIIVIDGVKYTLLNDFWGLGDVYEEENSDHWRCFAFNKPENGTIISGDGDDTGVFGYDMWDIGEDDYDVYVLRDYIDYTPEELEKRAIDDFYIYNTHHFAEEIIDKYIHDVFKNHMSDYAKFWIYELLNSDMSNSMVIAYCEGTDYTEINAIKDEFEEEITEAYSYLYPALDNWYEDFEKELTEIYEKEGWTKSETYEPDYVSGGIPGGTRGLCFVKFD